MPWGRATSCKQPTGQHGASSSRTSDATRVFRHSSDCPSQTTQRACLAGRPCCTVPPCDRLHVTQGLPSSGGLYPVPMLGSRLARTVPVQVQVRGRVHADSARRWCAWGAGRGDRCVCVCVFLCADKAGQLRRAHLWAASTGLPGLRCASIPFADDVMFSFGPGVAALWFRALGALWVVAAADMGGVSLQHWIITRALEQAPWTEPDRCRAGEGAR
jgi:hypothetical protein